MYLTILTCWGYHHITKIGLPWYEKQMATASYHLAHVIHFYMFPKNSIIRTAKIINIYDIIIKC